MSDCTHLGGSFVFEGVFKKVAHLKKTMLKIRKITHSPLFKLGFLVIFIILLFGYLRHNFSARASDEKINVYPQSFIKESNASALNDPAVSGGSLWQDVGKSLTTENDQTADFSSFNGGNSASLAFGRGVLTPAEKIKNEPNATSTIINSNVSSTPAVASPAANDQSSGESSSSDASAGGSNNPSSGGTDNQSPAPSDQSVPSDNLSPAGPAPAESAPADNSSNSSDSGNNPAPVIIDVDQPASAPSDAGPTSDNSGWQNSFRELGRLWKNFFSGHVAQAQITEADLAGVALTFPDSTTSTKPIELKDSLIFSDFNVDSYPAGSEITNVQLRLSLAARSNFAFDHLLIEYSTGGDWQTAGDLFLKDGAANAANGGYYLYAMPLFASWDDFDNLKVRISYENSELTESDIAVKAAQVYLDGIWLETDYNQGKVKGAKASANQEDRQNLTSGEEQTFTDENSLQLDDKKIDFNYGDDNTNENLIIKSDRQNYNGLSQSEVYLSVTNAGDSEEKFGLQAYFPDNSGNMTSLEKFSRKYAAQDEPVLGTLSFFCASGWETSTSSAEGYWCADKQLAKQCDSFSRDQKKCRQENVVIGTAPSSGWEDNWNKTDVFSGKLADNRNFIQKILGLGPKKKSVPAGFKPKKSTAPGSYDIKPGETQYFKMVINYNEGSSGEFYIETVGDQQGYGLLDPWWNASWNYEVPVTVTYTGTALTNFQVPVTIDTATLITAGKMKSDCSDIAFADTNKYSDTSELYYYLEPGSCNRSTTKVWVKIPSLTANKTIYLYYGNSAATSYSSGANTFVYFNDFETSNPFNSGSLPLIRRGGYSVKNGSLGLQSEGAGVKHLATIANSVSTGRNLIWESWVKNESSSTLGSLPGIQVGHPTGGGELVGFTAYSDARGGGNHYLAIRKDYDVAQILTYSDAYTVTNDSWLYLQFTWRSASNYLQASLFANSTTTTALATCTTTNASYTDGEYGVAGNQYAAWDEYRIRKYASSTISTSLGSETQIVNHVPTNPSSMQQYLNGTSTVLTNGVWANKNYLGFYATSTDKDADSITLFYELIGVGSNFTTATSAPSNYCSSNTAYTGCSYKIWSNGAITTGWYNASYPYRQQILADSTKLKGTLTNYPLYLDMTTLGITNPFWSHSKKNSDGGDILITDVNNNRVPVEVVSFSTSTKIGEIYFRASSISSTTDNHFYIYYGSSTASQPASSTTYGKNNVWSNGFVAVYHMNNNPAGTAPQVKDSVNGANNGTTAGGMTAGEQVACKIGNCLQFNTGSNQYVELPTANFTLTDITISLWAKNQDYPPSKVYTYFAHGRDVNANNFWINDQVSGQVNYREDGHSNAGAYIANTTWHNMAMTYNSGNTTFIGYFDGKQDGTAYAGGGHTTAADPDLTRIGILGYGNYYGANSYIDEVRVANSAREGRWLATDYNNISSSTTFFSTSTEQAINLAPSKYITIPGISDSTTGYKWQALACDSKGACSNWAHFNDSTPNFKIDATAPSFSGPLTPLASTTVSLKFGLPTLTETNFSQYKLYYRLGSTTPIHESDQLIGSSTTGYGYLGSATFSGKSSTTINNLATGTVYSFSLWAYDQAGNKASTSLVWERTDRQPTIAINIAAQANDASGKVGLNFTANDPDLDNMLVAQVDYFTDAYCHTTLYKATMDEVDADTIATYGDPKVQTKNAYQVGTSTGYITTASGANTVNTFWLAKTDYPTATGTACVKIVLNDNKGGLIYATSSVTIDNTAPIKPGSLTYFQKTGSTVTLIFGTPAYDKNFRQYKIYYKAGASGVKETDSVFSSSSDVHLGSMNYSGANIVTVNGLTGNTQYVFNIFAYDQYGNRASGTTEVVATTNGLPVLASGLAQYLSDGTTPISNNTWISQTSVKLYATSTDVNSTAISVYYQLATTSGNYLTVTSTPSSACTSGTSYANCPSRIWYTAAKWFNTSYQYRLRITTQGAKVASPLTNFPVYVDLSTLDPGSSFWSHARPNGGDLIVTKGDGITRLPLEIVSISTTTRSGELYFNADSLLAAANTNFYIYYGSSTASQPAAGAAYGKNAVWPSQYKGVWHLNEDPSAGLCGSGKDACDSTSNSLNLTATTSMTVANLVTGKLGYAYSFNGTTDYLTTLTTNLGQWMGKNFQFSAWVKFTQTGNDTIWLAPGLSGVEQNGGQDDTMIGVISAAGRMGMASKSDTNIQATTILNNNAWHLISFSRYSTSTGNITIYVDGAFNISGTSGAGNVGTPFYSFGRVESTVGGAKYYQGSIDEMRLTTGTTTLAWTTTQYNDQNSPSTFYTFGSEEQGSYVDKALISSIPDNNYKWQALACDENGCSKKWVQFNVTTPNIKIDTTAPTIPGSLIYNSKSPTSVKLNFGAATYDPSFVQYKIFYKQGTSGVKENNTLWGSSSAPALGYINYNGKSSTTITGLTTGNTYVFNIFAYDIFGRKASATSEVLVSLSAFPAPPYSLTQYDLTTSTVISNGSFIGHNSVYLWATSSGDTVPAMYYQLLDNASSFNTSTNTPSNTCLTGVSFASCTGKIWNDFIMVNGWYSKGYAYRTKITVNNSKVLANQTNFPVYFDMARLGASNNFWGNTKKNSSGGDLLITNSSGTRMPLEIVAMSTSSQTGELYFLADSLSSSAGTDFYLYYGSSTATQVASSSTYGSQKVWTTNAYKGVWHLNEANGSTAIHDSTGLNANGTLGGAPTLGSAGRIGNSVYFNAASRLLVAKNSVLEPSTRLTFQIWAESTGAQGGWAKPLWYGANAPAPYGVYGFEYANAQGVDTEITDGANQHKAPTYTDTLNTWFSIAGVYNGAATIAYVNGYQTGSTTWNGVIGTYDASGLCIGDKAPTGQPFLGYVDEVRIASSSRSNSWFATEFNDENNPGTFFTTSSEQYYLTYSNKPVQMITIPDGSYKWQAIACFIGGCSNWSKYNLNTPNFKIDTVAPTAPGQLTLVSRKTNSITLGFGSASVEANFKQYKIFYKQGTSGVNENNTLFGSSSDSSLSYLNYNNVPSVTISGLVANTNYVFNIWAYDQIGNKTSSTAVTFQTVNSITETYYYTSGASDGWINPPFAWDNTNNTYAYRLVPANSANDFANYLQGTANNVATTSKTVLGVELGLEGYVKDPNNISYKVIPLFSGLNSGGTHTLAGSLFGRTDSDNTFYTDITSDANAPSHWTWNDIVNLDAYIYANNASSSIANAYVDQIRLRVTVDSYPDTAKNLVQYKSDKVTVLTNGAYFNQKNIVLKGEATDPDPSEGLSLYYQFIPTSQTFTASTSRPTGACASGDAYAGCSSKIWVASYSGTPKDFSVTPFIGTSSITSIPDGTYKWQAKVCDLSDICSVWTSYNVTTPNLTIDATAPTVPGKLIFSARTSGTINVKFSATTTDTNFSRYRIFYRKGSTSPVTEADLEQSDTNLLDVNFNHAVTTTVAGLAKSSWYTFNIWAYDLAGNKASATPMMIASTTAGYMLNQTSYLMENDDGAGVNLNSPSSAFAGVPLTNVQKGQRINARIQIQNTGADQTYNKRFKIQYENNTDAPGVWTDVGIGTPISYSYAISGANGDAIVATKCAANGNTWSNGLFQEYTNWTNMYNLTTNHYTEFVFAVQTAYAAVGKTYRLRLIDGTGSSTFDVYSNYPTLTMTGYDAKKYSKDSLSGLPVNYVDLTYFLDNPGYTALGADDSSRDPMQSSAGQYPIYNFATRDWSSGYVLNALWNGQSNVAQTSNPVTLQIYRFGSVNAWTTLASNTSSGANTDFNLNGVVDYHISDYLSGGYVYWRVYQNSGAEIFSPDYFSFTTSTPTAYVTGRHYRWRNDDASYGTWREAQDTPDPTLGTAINKNVNVRLRLSFTDTKAGSASNYGFGLQYATTSANCSSGGLSSWYTVKSTATSTSHFQIAYSPQFANASTTGAQLSTDSYTYTLGNMVNYSASTSSAITLAEDRDTEVEWSIKATTNAKSGQTYCFRGTKNGTALNAYDRYAELTIGGTTNTAPSFTTVPSDNGSATTTPTTYGQNVTFTGTASDAQTDQYYLAICQTNSIVAGNGGAPTCLGGSWCISSRASSTQAASCTVNTAHFNSESYPWYGFACDYRYGAGIAACSAMSQGTVSSPNASPFRINHPPSFSAVTTLNDYKDPGTLFNIQATAADTDTNNTWSYYVCTTNGASASGCTGGAGNTVCSAVATTTANPICHYQSPATYPSGAYTYYAFVYDNFSLGATTSPKSSAYHVNNVAPVLGALSINNNANITLNIKGASPKQVLLVDTSVTDLNGCQTLVSATGVVYRTSLGYNCTAEDNTCYQIAPANCILSACSGASDAIATYTCSTSLKYFAEPTDNSTNNPWSYDNWSGRIQVYDGSNYAATTSPTVEVNTNSALDVAQRNISFGLVNPGADTGTTDQQTTIINDGNSPLNSNVAGTNMIGKAGGAIASTNIHWNLTAGFNYPTGNTLKIGGEVVSINLPRPTSDADISNLIYWGIGVPATSTHTTFKGSSTFAAVLNTSGW
jgi:hypothetical protein